LKSGRNKRNEEEKKIEAEINDYKANVGKFSAAIHANTYKIDEKFKAQLEHSANNISNSVLLGKKRLKKKNIEMLQSQKEQNDTLSLLIKSSEEKRESTLNLNADQPIEHEDDWESKFVNTGKRKLKRFKLDEDKEREIKEENAQRDRDEVPEQSLKIPLQSEPCDEEMQKPEEPKNKLID